MELSFSRRRGKPAADEGSFTLQQSSTAPAGPASAAIFTATPTALIVDDDPVARRRLYKLLSNMGVAVNSCASVAEGLKALQEDIGEHGCVTFTRIFCDIVMPEASGDALLGLLTSSGWPCSVVMVTGEATDEMKEKCESMGALAVISKPVRRSVLQAFFVAEATRDGRLMPGRPAPSLGKEAGKWSQLADALIGPAHDAKRGAAHAALRAGSVPSWTVAPGVSLGRSLSAPRLRERRAQEQPDDHLDWTHTGAAVHALAMGAALALAVHVQASDCDAGQKPTGQAAEDARFFEEQRAPGEEVPVASAERIFRFLMVLIINNQLDMAVAIEAVIFLERASRRSSIGIGHNNWKSLLLAAVILASKAHYDEQVWLEDFVGTLRMYHLSAPELHRLEMALLRLTDYGTLVRQSTFTLYSIELVALHHAACPFCRVTQKGVVEQDRAERHTRRNLRKSLGSVNLESVYSARRAAEAAGLEESAAEAAHAPTGVAAGGSAKVGAGPTTTSAVRIKSVVPGAALLPEAKLRQLAPAPVKPVPPATAPPIAAKPHSRLQGINDHISETGRSQAAAGQPVAAGRGGPTASPARL